MVDSHRESAVAPSGHCRCWSARKSPAAWRRDCPFGRSRGALDEQRRASPGRSHAMVVRTAIGRPRPMRVLGSAPGGRSHVCWLGGAGSQIVTLVERHSRYVMLVKVASKDTVTVTKALTKVIRQLPAELRRSLTWDRGSEMAAHKEFAIATDMHVYFCDPRSPWQRG